MLCQVYLCLSVFIYVHLWFQKFYFFSSSFSNTAIT